MYFKTTTFLILMACIHASTNYAPSEDEDKSKINCSKQRKCSTSEDIVWAIDNKQCYLFRNPCIFANEMCMRRNKKQEEYKVVTREECTEYCRYFCTDDYTPVCGEYDNAYKTFSNECEFYGHSCQNNQSYIFLQAGECNQTVAA